MTCCGLGARRWSVGNGFLVGPSPVVAMGSALISLVGYRGSALGLPTEVVLTGFVPRDEYEVGARYFADVFLGVRIDLTPVHSHESIVRYTSLVCV